MTKKSQCFEPLPEAHQNFDGSKSELCRGFHQKGCDLEEVKGQHQIRIDPADHAGDHISDLKEVVDVRITCSTPAVDYLPYLPILISPLAGQIVVAHDHRHA